MGGELIKEVFDKSILLFPPEWIKSALVLALISAWVVIALFAYLNHATRRPYFSLWTVAWMFYAVYLAASIGLLESPDSPGLMMARGACIGISALFMFWGSFQLAHKGRRQRELTAGVLMIGLWSYIAAFQVRERLWITLPVFALLALAGVYTGVFYIRHRKRYLGAIILGMGFILWGLHLLLFPFAELSPRLMAGGYLASCILAILITVGMVVEQEVTTSEHNYRELFDLAIDAQFLLEPESLRVIEANLAATELTGYRCTELVNRPLADFFPDLQEAGNVTVLLRSVNAPRAELTLPRPGGQSIICEARASLTMCPKGEVVQVTMRDITERKRVEQSLQTALTELRHTQHQVVQQERLRAMEKMASGVAHDFNNALAKVLGFNELLLAFPENLDNKDKVKKFLQMSNAAARDAVHVVDRLREFYRHRKQSEVYLPVDLNQVLEQAIVLTQPRWKHEGMANGTTIQLEPALSDLPPLIGDADDLREAALNLIFNAVEAMPDGGTLTVRTSCEAGQIAWIVADTGVGMSEEVRTRCLEPFFSTKDTRGTGLGLAIVYGVVQRHSGTIEVVSEENKGTTITVRLPVAPDETPAATKTPDQSPPLNVLLVEDDLQVLDFETEYLRGDGHSVVTATNGREALEKFRAGRFDIVVADRALPDLNGDQLAAAVKSARPNTPVLIVTGFHDGRATVADVVVSKPITQGTLRQMVAQLHHASPPKQPNS